MKRSEWQLWYEMLLGLWAEEAEDDQSRGRGQFFLEWAASIVWDRR